MSFLFLIPIIKISSLVGIIYIFGGILFYFFRPTKINSIYGYRTTSSMKNQERWGFAQTYASLKMLESGIWLLLLSLIGFIIHLNIKHELIIGIFLVLFFTAYLIISTEKAIKRKFKK